MANTTYRVSASSDPWKAPKGLSRDMLPLHYRINGMFTLPKARGQGIAKALLQRSIEYGRDEAFACGKTFELSILVDADNLAARSLYEKSGFALVREEAFEGTSRVILLLKYSPALTPSHTTV